jgi:hypothetical protein
MFARKLKATPVAASANMLRIKSRVRFTDAEVGCGVLIFD